jgi:hypothetical protein
MNAHLRVLSVTVLAVCLTLAWQPPAEADDDIDLMMRQGRIPANVTGRHGYSDFTDPLGRFLDLLAAGALVEARSIQREACAEWVATRQNSAFAGKFWVWDTEISLDRLCASH